MKLDPNKKCHQIKKTLKKSMKTHKNLTLFFSFEKHTMNKSKISTSLVKFTANFFLVKQNGKQRNLVGLKNREE